MKYDDSEEMIFAHKSLQKEIKKDERALNRELTDLRRKVVDLKREVADKENIIRNMIQRPQSSGLFRQSLESVRFRPEENRNRQRVRPSNRPSKYIIFACF